MRTLRLLMLVALLGAFASTAHAAGLDLAWNDCGSFGVCNQSFACNVNGPGTFMLIGSFTAPEGLTQFVGLEARVDFVANDTAMPDWWQFRNAGTCRQAGVTADADFSSGPYSCTDPWLGQAAGGMAGWLVGSPIGPGVPGNGGRMVIALARPAQFAGPLVADEAYYAFRVNVNKTKTVGAGSCAGCTTPMGIAFTQVKLMQPVGMGDFVLSTWNYQGFAAWQNGMFPVYDVAYMCPFVIPAKNRTWGSIKSLYH